MSRIGNAKKLMFPIIATLVAAGFIFGNLNQSKQAEEVVSSNPETALEASTKSKVKLVTYQEPVYGAYGNQPGCDGCSSGGMVTSGPVMAGAVQSHDCNSCGGDAVALASGYGPANPDGHLPVKSIQGVDGQTCRILGREAKWKDSRLVPWEMFAYGEYIGPHRTPHVPEYRIRVNDTLEFVYMLTRERRTGPYRIQIGDTLQMSSAIDTSLNQREITVISDGMISLPLIGQVQAAGTTLADLQRVLNKRYEEFVNEPSIAIQVVRGDTLLNDLRDAVDARQGQGGQSRQAAVAPDGTLQLPLIGSVPAIGLSLDEVRREVNARYRSIVSGIEVTPILLQRAARFVYVVGQVGEPGRFEMVAPTTVIQAIALAQGDLATGNLRNVVVLRRDQDWRMVATRLDLQGAINGRRPYPSDDFYLRDSDIIIVPRKPITRLSEAVNLYLSETLFQIFPQELVFDLDFQTGL